VPISFQLFLAKSRSARAYRKSNEAATRIRPRAFATLMKQPSIVSANGSNRRGGHEASAAARNVMRVISARVPSRMGGPQYPVPAFT
jgi:hypothetical protein